MKKQSWSKILSNDHEIADVLNNFFSNVVKTLGIPQNVYFSLFMGDTIILQWR